MNSKAVPTIVIAGLVVFILGHFAITRMDQDPSRTQHRPAEAAPATGEDHQSGATPPVVSQPTQIKMVTPADYPTEIDNAPQVLIQLCQADACAADRAVLERLAPRFVGVKFVQMSTSDNQELTERMKSERAEMQKLSPGQDWSAYPVYLFKGAELYVAPPITSDDQLKVFIETNASFQEPDGSEKDDTVPEGEPVKAGDEVSSKPHA